MGIEENGGWILVEIARMDNITLIAFILITVILIGIAIVQAVALRRSRVHADPGHSVGNDLRIAREESAAAARVLREEVRGQLREGTEALTRELAGLGAGQDKRLDLMDRTLVEFRATTQGAYETTRTTIETRLQNIAVVNDRKAEEMRREAAVAHKSLLDLLSHHLQVIAAKVETLNEGNEKSLTSVRETVDARIRELRAGVETKVTEMRGEVTARIKEQDEHLVRDLSASKESQREYLERMILRLGEVGSTIQTSLETIRTTIDGRLMTLTTANQGSLRPGERRGEPRDGQHPGQQREEARGDARNRR